jgi:hypothetical protein
VFRIDNPSLQVIRKSSSLDGGVELDGYTLINLSSSYAINNNAKVLLNIKNAGYGENAVDKVIVNIKKEGVGILNRFCLRILTICVSVYLDFFM